jgi:Domain of unknown function (DUF4262)
MEDKDTYLQELGRRIRQQGWVVQYIGDPQIPWAYTIGLSDRGHPELVITGVDPGTSAVVLNTIAKACRSGVDISDLSALAEEFGHPQVVLQPRPVDPTWRVTNLFNITRAYFGSVPETMQVVMADTQGRFPWDPGHNLPVAQPVLWQPYTGGWPEA